MSSSATPPASQPSAARTAIAQQPTRPSHSPVQPSQSNDPRGESNISTSSSSAPRRKRGAGPQDRRGDRRMARPLTTTWRCLRPSMETMVNSTHLITTTRPSRAGARRPPAQHGPSRPTGTNDPSIQIVRTFCVLADGRVVTRYEHDRLVQTAKNIELFASLEREYGGEV